MREGGSLGWGGMGVGPFEFAGLVDQRPKFMLSLIHIQFLSHIAVIFSTRRNITISLSAGDNRDTSTRSI